MLPASIRPRSISAMGTLAAHQAPSRCFTATTTAAAAAAATASYTSTPAAKPTTKLAPLQQDEVFYFAFGSNMSPKVLTGRRMVQPRQSLPCCVRDHVLSFDVQGFPYSEPGFATIVTKTDYAQGSSSSSSNDRPCVHGVMHRITRREWAYIKATEGVGSTQVGYQVVPVTCELSDGSAVTAVTLKSATASMHQVDRQARPSQRYLQLLLEGAAHHGLDPQYQQWLSTIKPYRPASTLQSALGTAISGAVLMSAVAPAIPVYVAGRTLGLVPQPDPDSSSSSSSSTAPSDNAATAGSSSSSSTTSAAAANTRAGSGSLLPFLSWYLNRAQAFTWRVHDTAIAPVLGSGCTSD